MNFHEFMTEVQAIVKPKVYLEIGVEVGNSLRLARHSEIAIGVDPQRHYIPEGNQVVYNVPSDDYFNLGANSLAGRTIDLGLVDGLHIAEQAMRDFLNIADRLSGTGIIIIDDVLPRNQAEANRVQCPNDWTGDVWKMAEWLAAQPEVQSIFVNTQLTGVLLVTGASKAFLRQARMNLARLTSVWQQNQLVPDHVLKRTRAWDPVPALASISQVLSKPRWG